jgi:hypothetical protein
MLVIAINEVEFCGIQRPMQPITLGFTYQDLPYYLEPSPWVKETTAKDHFRARLEKPHTVGERCLLVEGSEGFRLAIHEPDLQVIPYAEALAHLCNHMQVSGTLKIGTHRWGLRSYDNSFVGSDAVTWLASYLHISRPEAIALGQSCIDQGLFNHVLGEQPFADEYYFYRFSQAGDPEKRAVTLA